MFRLPTLRFATCYNCRAPKPTKRCKPCKTAGYCFEECQKVAWKAHRVDCQRFADFQVEFTRRMEQETIEDLTDRWIASSEPILAKFVLLAVDLANNPVGLAVNVFVGYEARIPDNGNVMKVQFEIVTGWVCSDEVLYRSMRTRPDAERDIEEMQSDRANNPNTVRLILANSSHCDAAIFVRLDGVDADRCKRQNPYLSAVRSLTWVANLKAALEAGDVDVTI